MVNVDGLISGIDTEAIINGLLEVQKSQVDRLNARRQEVQAKQAAFQAIQAQVLSLRSAGSTLSRTQNSVFDARAITVSSPDSLVATAASKAAVGVYQIRVDSLARAHQVASQGFADADSSITEGTFVIRTGNQPETTITIDSSNSTLAGLADAINFSGAGVSASIVQDGSGSGASYRLLLTSKQTGSSSEISITNNLAASSGAAQRPDFDFDNPVQAAANAQVRLGDGPGAITVQSQTNQVNNLISGVTLNLLAADSNKTVAVSVTQDTETAVTAVSDFVNTFNGVMDFIDQLVKYAPETDTAAVLVGDRSVIDIQNELRQALQSVIPGVSGKANRLSTLGISVDDHGKLVLNKSKLTSAVKGDVTGVTSADLRRLFALDGRSSNGGVEFLLGSARTVDSTVPYQVDITQAAERATITGAGSLAASTVIDSSNRDLSIGVDGTQVSIQIKEGTYTAAQLAAELEAAINSHPELTGRQVLVGLSPTQQLTFTSATYGSSSKINVYSGSALGSLGLVGGESDIGVDVAGSFIVNGQVETATGRGRILTGDSGNAHTADIQLRITLSPNQVISGPDADLSVTRGITARLDKLIGELSNSDKGRFQSINDSYNQQLESIQASIDRQQATFDRQQQDLIKRFSGLESALGKLQTTASFLSAQLAGLGGIGGTASS